jgi:hypothetical protein
MGKPVAVRTFLWFLAASLAAARPAQTAAAARGGDVRRGERAVLLGDGARTFSKLAWI